MANGNDSFWKKYESRIKGWGIVIAIGFSVGGLIFQFAYTQGVDDSTDTTVTEKIVELEEDFEIHCDTASEQLSEKADKEDLEKLSVQVDKLDSVVTVIKTTQDIEFQNIKERQTSQDAKLDAILAKIG